MSTASAPAQEDVDDAQRDTVGLIRQITQSSTMVVLMAVVAAMVLSGLLVLFTNDQVREAAGYFFSRPGDMFAAIGDTLATFYSAFFTGAIYNPDASTFARSMYPLTETLTRATPLIFAGLGLGLGFRAGMFNIGAQGQMLIGATLGSFIGFAWDLPIVLHLIVAILGCVLGGALWGFIPGFLKARTGAHEVITTIMLNYIALSGVAWLLDTSTFRRPGLNTPRAPLVSDDAAYPLIIEDMGYRLHWGFVLAIACAFGVWWLLERSTLGFQLRAVGANVNAARTAGMNVSMIYVLVMVIAGGLAGAAGSAQILGVDRALTVNLAGQVGFDAITVALLGRSRPLGIVLAGLLFGGFRASVPAIAANPNMDVPVDIVLVVQAVIVLFIAAPPLVRFLFRLPVPAHEKVVTA